MTVTTTGNRTTHNGNGSTTVFSYNKKHLQSSDLDVYVDGTLRTENGAGTYDYTVSPTTGGTTASITFNTAPVSGTSNVVIINNPDQTQEVDLKTSGKIPADTLEEALDKAVMLILQLQDATDKKIGFSTTSTNTGTIPDFESTSHALVADSSNGFSWGTFASLSTDIDTTFTGLATNDFLQYDGSVWVNKTPTEVATAISAVSTSANNDFTGTNTFAGKTAFKDDGELTISSGAVTITGAAHTIDTESDAASDDLDTINGGADGEIIVIRAENTARTVVIKDGTGNIETPNGEDISLTSTNQVVVLQYDAALSDWLVLAAPQDTTVNAIGSIGGGTQDIDLNLGRAVSATVDTSTTTFTFSNPKPTGFEDSFTLYLTNGGSQTVNWPGSVIWAGGTPPSLTTSGVDVLVFTTIDGGTTWYGFASGLDLS